jgi:hypothetical protein
MRDTAECGVKNVLIYIAPSCVDSWWPHTARGVGWPWSEGQASLTYTRDDLEAQSPSLATRVGGTIISATSVPRCGPVHTRWRRARGAAEGNREHTVGVGRRRKSRTRAVGAAQQAARACGQLEREVVDEWLTAGEGELQ